MKTKTAKIIAIFVLFCSLIIITGWYLDLPFLFQFNPKWASIKFSTALCFFLSSPILFLGAQFQAAHSNNAKILSPLFAFIILLLMTTLLTSSLTGIYTGIENIFLPEKLENIKSISAGIPSLGTMTAFILISIVGLSYLGTNEKIDKTNHICGTLLIFIGCIALIGYFLNLPALYFYIENISTGMNLLTALLFSLLGLGFFLSKKEKA